MMGDDGKVVDREGHDMMGYELESVGTIRGFLEEYKMFRPSF